MTAAHLTVGVRTGDSDVTERPTLKYFMDVNLRTGAGESGTSGNSIAQLALGLEASGFDGVGFTDHPAPSAKWLAGGGHDTLDPFSALSFCAAITKEIKLLSHLLVVPYRNPLLQATSIASVDFLSGGRSIFVLGAGYLRSEFAALGVDFNRRNELFDEYIDVIMAYSIGDEFSYDGTGYKAVGQRRSPVSIQRPHPPFWLGGNSGITRDRVARWAQGWSVLMGPPSLAATTRTPAITNFDDLRTAISDVERRTAEYGRDFTEITIQAAGEHLNLTGESTADQQLAEVDRLAELGVSWIHVPMGNWELNETLDRINAFSANVIPSASKTVG